MEEDGKKSLFNAGIALAERIDSLQRAINGARFNLVAFNPEVGKYNYEIIISSLDGLVLESWAKLTKTEKEDADKFAKIIKLFIRYKPLISFNMKGSSQINQKNAYEFFDILVLYEKRVKEFLDSHDLNSPSKEDDEGL